jgi:hypothetical protein
MSESTTAEAEAGELASWIFPNEPAEDAKRDALYGELLEVIAGTKDPADVARRYSPDQAEAAEKDILAMVERVRGPIRET